MNFVSRDQVESERRNYGWSSPHIAMNAAIGGAGPLPIIMAPLADPIPVVSVTIDVSGFREPAVLLNFTGIISLPLGASVTLNFQVSRISAEGAVIVGSNYTFSSQVNIPEAESFGFQLFDPYLVPGNHTYTVQLSTNSIADVTPGVTISNVTLSALGVETV